MGGDVADDEEAPLVDVGPEASSSVQAAVPGPDERWPQCECAGKPWRDGYRVFMRVWVILSQAGNIFQIVKIHINEDATSVSVYAQFVWTMSSLFWVVYAWMVNVVADHVLRTSSLLGATTNLYLLALVFRYGDFDFE